MIQNASLSRRFTSASSSTRAFTLVEIIVVGVIIAILAAVGLPALVDAIQGGTARATLAKMKLVNDAKARFVIEQAAAGVEVDETSAATFANVAPFLSQGGAAPATAADFMVGTGGRALAVGNFNAGCTVTPAVPTKYVVR